MPRLLITFFGIFLAPLLAFAQNDVTPPDAKPVLMWKFEAFGEPGVSKSATKFFESGPRRPVYPSFAADNTAMGFSAANPSITVSESAVPNAAIRFSLNDSITLEAWVKPASQKDGSYEYILGKGRNRKPGFPEKNQNYALRLKGEQGESRASFLFASAPADGKPADWHRWTSTKGFTGSGWHHVAITYTFGKPESIRGYIDGVEVKGTWDMGGATTRAPVTDADDITIGTGNGGGAGNTFRGALDEVAIWRTAVPAEVLKNRFEFVPPPPVVKRAELPRGSVLVQICEEGMPARNAWPDTPPTPATTYREDVFGFFEVPHKYVDTGVRGDRGYPFLVRAAAIVNFPAGKHRLLLRGRGTSRLYVDEKLILTTPYPTGNGSGHGTIRTTESYLNLGPDFRFAPPGNGESWANFETKGGDHLVVMETIVGHFIGNNKRRPELGETVVAVSFEGSESWQLVSPGKRVVPYTDAGWEAYEAERRVQLEEMNSASRAARRADNAPYWDKRRAAAKVWVDSAAQQKVPALPKGYPGFNAIDAFLATRVEQVRGQANTAPGAIDYFKQIQPIFEASCVACHTGNKAKGALRLDDRAAALVGGKNEGAAIVPGKPAESALLLRVKSNEESEVMPPKGEKLTGEQIRLLESWIREGARWPDLNAEYTTFTPLTDDLTFLRRLALDTVGVPPTPEEIRTFTTDSSPDKRARAIDRFLADPRWADHWMGYWQDVLAENPNILNPTLNNTGPFRWWLHESLLDNKPMDLFVTELLRMRGSERFGGPAGFATASQNDVPMAMKGTVVATAFLGIEMKCARCHDAPAHESTQRELFELAALLGAKSLKVPATSSVPLDKVHEGGRKPLISVTLKPGTEVQPKWPFASFVPEAIGRELAQEPEDTRDRLAALITAPQNERFAQVMANRIWKRFMGRGIVEPVDDWERGKPSHPELLRWLGQEFVRNGYDTKKFARIILNSHAYQRAADPKLKQTPVLFTAPAHRRLTAEQIVDSLFAATEKPFRVEEVSLDVDGGRTMNSSITLGQPRRAWMLASTSNERDRPSLSLPRIQMMSDVLEAFGWRSSRQDPLTVREMGANVLQPAILQNGPVGMWLTRLTDDHGVTKLALRAKSPDALLDELYLKLLTRKPTDKERAAYVPYIAAGYETRRRAIEAKPVMPRKPKPYVSWSNHLHPQATVIKMQQEEAARRGDPPTEQLDSEWRARMEDVLWSILNSSEFVFTP